PRKLSAHLSRSTHRSRERSSWPSHLRLLTHCAKIGLRRSPPNRDFMIDAVLAKIFGTKNERDVKAIRPLVTAMNALEPELQQLSDIDLAARTIGFKEQLAQGAPLDDLLVPSFAVVREAGRRVLNMRHFDEQLVGG